MSKAEIEADLAVQEKEYADAVSHLNFTQRAIC